MRNASHLRRFHRQRRVRKKYERVDLVSDALADIDSMTAAHMALAEAMRVGQGFRRWLKGWRRTVQRMSLAELRVVCHSAGLRLVRGVRLARQARRRNESVARR